ncbi:hypothetical protein [Rhizobium leguminosarum]|uniref:hypothetical protein n=1 Tax=Rhizobium leguminosarum TaxID=384 RepID=UPI002E14F497|nr:hypothetical protein U8Q02_42835 [Rhizobium leguminosarum]
MKKQLKRIGFFRELPYGGPEGLSINSSLSEFSLEKKVKVISYLRSGTACVVSPGVSRDVISSERDIIGALSLLTDGVFLWPSDFPYYFEKYSVGIPQEFLEHMEQNVWVISTDINIQNLEL